MKKPRPETFSRDEVTERFAGLTAVELGRMVESEMGRPLPDDFFTEQKEELDRRLASESARTM